MKKKIKKRCDWNRKSEKREKKKKMILDHRFCDDPESRIQKSLSFSSFQNLSQIVSSYGGSA